MKLDTVCMYIRQICKLYYIVALLNWRVFDLRRPGGSPAQRIANLFVPTGEKSVVTTRRHFSKNEFVKWNVKRKMSSMVQNVSIISHSISNIRQSLWTMKPPPQRDASAGLSEIQEMATNDKQKWKPATATGGLWWFCLLSRLISVAFVFWTSYRLQLWPSALSQWSNVFRCLYHRLGTSKILSNVHRFFRSFWRAVIVIRIQSIQDPRANCSLPFWPQRSLTYADMLELPKRMVPSPGHLCTTKLQMFSCYLPEVVMFIIAPEFGE